MDILQYRIGVATRPLFTVRPEEHIRRIVTNCDLQARKYFKRLRINMYRHYLRNMKVSFHGSW